MTGAHIRRKSALLLSAPLALALACDLAGSAGGNLSATQTALAFSIYQYSTFGPASPTPRPPLPTGGGATRTPSATPTPTVSPTATSTATVPPTATAAHLATPPGTGGATRYVVDASSKDYAAQKRAASGADAYALNRYERPFTSQTMGYLPDVDLTRAELRVDPPWVYVTLWYVAARPEGVGKTMYGAEFDVDRDGRGNYLIWGASPAGENWTTDGVEVWQDANFDVGGPRPQLADAPWSGGNGYDRKVFSGGQGADPDLAWIRRAPGGSAVQLALKYSAIGEAKKFFWNGLADIGVRRPDWFDYNDHFTQSAAGSPLPIQPDYYPLQELWGVDNTCRDASGFTPDPGEAGLC